MHIDVLVAEIGSTTTVLNAFNGVGTASVCFLAQGQSATTVLDGDVTVGLNRALDDLKAKLNASSLNYDTMLATGSAAGGLRMSVHGLVSDMTVSAARAAALGAGGIVINATSGIMDSFDIQNLKRCRPNLIMLCGGTDYGERKTAIFNLQSIIQSGIKTPMVYCGNVQNQTVVKELCIQSGIPLSITENVYPKLDMLNIEPVRRCIHDSFERHIVSAPGMEHIKEMVNGKILPTPGSVMLASELLYDILGDVCVIDIGGATTDVHSVTDGSDEIAQMLTSPEPKAKRTVEGDLGAYINAVNIIDLIGKDKLNAELNIDTDSVMKAYKPIPETSEQLKLTQRLCLQAGLCAIDRHAGRLRHLYTPSGRRTIAEGKDLTMIKYLVGTGGALTRLPERMSIMRSIADCNKNRMMLFPKPSSIKLLCDNHYIMASLGVLSTLDRQGATILLKRSLAI